MPGFDRNIDFNKTKKIKYIEYPHPKGPIKIAVSDEVVSETIQKKIRDARYERHEANIIQKIVTDGDILLELGAGVGFISTLAWSTGKVKEVHCFEADPRLKKIIEATHAQNGVSGNVYTEILSNDAEQIEKRSIDFHIREDFYGSSLNSGVGREIKQTVPVPVTSIRKAIETIKPTVIACDIEGGELGLFDEIDMPTVRQVMVETHVAAFKGEGMRQLFHEFHKADFYYDPVNSYREVVVFRRM
ncbi:methyltransferase, FkbM family [Xaviernesmea oryzae]|uniref:Methyltransferase, FkbM family n=1 Tax=Xaviernesmea oryzae TaxID=464029 RepID=A0A1X7FSB8_9HYPH|nr:FkbM family methyltransferase [Xaviernesmea oryzae]SMF57875.1 methyltransferase, FkbM family [Xaviernesmea oryzae]